MNCRNCKSNNFFKMLDLGKMPLANAYLKLKDLKKKEKKYPLVFAVCKKCWLVQTIHKISNKIIFKNDYAYFSSYSKSWLEHSKKYVEEICNYFGKKSFKVLEIASNDGYLLQYFKKKNIYCLGVEPTKGTAIVAEKKGINVIKDFFSFKLSMRLKSKKKMFDLVIANNVIAHVPDFYDIIKGIENILTNTGIATFEFPHTIEMFKKNEFDTIYHEHYSYFTATVFNEIIKKNGLKIFKIKKLKSHGGSIRVYVCKNQLRSKKIQKSVIDLLSYEKKVGVLKINFYKKFRQNTLKIKNNFLKFIHQIKKRNATICCYGAAAKGNTFLNFMKLTHRDIKFVVDQNPQKQNKFLPGSKIPIKNSNFLINNKCNYILVLPWNLKKEIFKYLKQINILSFSKGLVAIPKLIFFK